MTKYINLRIESYLEDSFRKAMSWGGFANPDIDEMKQASDKYLIDEKVKLLEEIKKELEADSEFGALGSKYVYMGSFYKTYKQLKKGLEGK